MRPRIGDGEWLVLENGTGLLVYPGWAYSVSKARALEHSKTLQQYAEYRRLRGDPDNTFVQCSATGFLAPLLLLPFKSLRTRIPIVPTTIVASLLCGVFACQRAAKRIDKFQVGRANDTIMHLNASRLNANPVYAQYHLTAALAERFWTTENLGPLPFTTPLPTDPHWARTLNTALKTFSWRWQRWFHHTFWTPRMERASASFFVQTDTRAELEATWKMLFRWGLEDDVFTIPVRFTFERKGDSISAAYWAGMSPHRYFVRQQFSRQQVVLFQTYLREERFVQLQRIVDASENFLVLEASAEAYVAHRLGGGDRDREFERQFGLDCQDVIKAIYEGAWNFYNQDNWSAAVGLDRKFTDYAEGSMKRVLELALDPKKEEKPSAAVSALTREVEFTPKLADEVQKGDAEFVGDEALRAASNKGEKKGSSQQPNREKVVTLPPENKVSKPAGVEKKEAVALPAVNKGVKKEQPPQAEEKTETKGEEEEREGK